MQYYGNLYGKVAGKYFDTGKTAEDFDNLEKEIKELTQKGHDEFCSNQELSIRIDFLEKSLNEATDLLKECGLFMVGKDRTLYAEIFHFLKDKS